MRHTTMTWSALSLGVLLATTAAQAQSYPSKTITIVVTAAAGGVSDVVARGIGQRLSEAWGQQVVIENKGGGAHIIGAQVVAKAPPDGHTLLVAEAGTYVLNPTLYPKDKLAYDTEKDIAPITGLVRINQALIANNGLAAQNARELVDLANKKPGEITYGTAGVGSAPHMNIIKFENMAKVKLQPIHYRGAAPALNDLIPGRVDSYFGSASLLENMRSGQIRGLGVTGLKRDPVAPELPTIAEAGVPGYEVSSWQGLFVPARTPPEMVKKMSVDTIEALADPAARRKLEQAGYPVAGSSPGELQALLRSDIDKWSHVIKTVGIKID
jgi:tripartite-type tricarboxylate transporter receptor subunit TctC